MTWWYWWLECWLKWGCLYIYIHVFSKHRLTYIASDCSFMMFTPWLLVLLVLTTANAFQVPSKYVLVSNHHDILTHRTQNNCNNNVVACMKETLWYKPRYMQVANTNHHRLGSKLIWCSQSHRQKELATTTTILLRGWLHWCSPCIIFDNFLQHRW